VRNKKIHWFENWFDSPYYHLLYQNRDNDEAQHFIRNLTAHLQLKPRAKLLDLACGKGRHSIFFSKNNFITTGIDLSAQSIRYAEQFENELLSFFIHDMRRPFRVNYFDVVMNLFTSFGYFENEKDNFRTLQAAAMSLKSGGLLIIDFMNAEKAVKEIQAYEEKKVCDIVFHIKKKIVNQFLVKEINFTDNEEEFYFTESVKTLNLKSFEKYFTACGLVLKDHFGSYDLSPFDQEKSERLILIAQKK
jgi:SAM-dependent methyltransferase